MKVWSLLPVICLVAACGVDGEPIPPGSDESEEDETVSQSVDTQKTDVSTSTVISAGSNGVNAGVATTLSRGNVSVTVGTLF